MPLIINIYFIFQGIPESGCTKTSDSNNSKKKKRASKTFSRKFHKRRPTATSFYDLRKDEINGDFMDTLYHVCGPTNALFSGSWDFSLLLNWRRSEYGNSPPCSTGLLEWGYTFIRQYAYVVLVSLTTV
jgi:hypothetical protein